jgi:hypothetical protein
MQGGGQEPNFLYNWVIFVRQNLHLYISFCFETRRTLSRCTSELHSKHRSVVLGKAGAPAHVGFTAIDIFAAHAEAAKAFLSLAPVRLPPLPLGLPFANANITS